jgi:hypothetical protein
MGVLARYILHTREMSAVITFVVRRFCSLLVTDPRSVRRHTLDALKKVRDGSLVLRESPSALTTFISGKGAVSRPERA